MISRDKISEASDELDEIAIDSLVATIRTTAIYKSNPAYFSGMGAKFSALNGTVGAQQINAVLDELEILGIGEAQINQAQTVGTDGLVYSQTTEREALVEYALSVVYEGFSSSTPVIVTPTGDLINTGKYMAGRLPLIYEGYL